MHAPFSLSIFCLMKLLPSCEHWFFHLKFKDFYFFFTSATCRPLTAILTSSGHHWGNWEEGHWRFWYMVSTTRRDGPPQGWLWAQCAVSQNIMTCHKLLYKEGSLHVLFNMLSYSQSVIYPLPFLGLFSPPPVSSISSILCEVFVL